jgi:hypothetical protein
MRFGFAVMLTAVLSTSFVARGEEVAQPVPSDRTCSVPADEHWTNQEKFVWERACVGEVADFNKETAYGGNLDPRKPEGLPESRVLTSAFLETVLLKDKYRGALTRRGVRIVGARFKETVDLANAELRHDLWLDQSLLEEGANLSGLSSTRDLRLDGSKIGRKLDLSRIHVGQSLSMNGSAEFVDVDLSGAYVGGNLDLNESKVTGVLTMMGLQAEKDITLVEAKLAKGANLENAHARGNLYMYGTEANGIYMNFLQIDGSINISGSIRP